MKNKYFVNLDGLRAIAALAVMFFHICLWIPKSDTHLIGLVRSLFNFNGHGGEYGVIFFFILSGFLITYLLISEREKYGKINLVFFYCRRALRIWPLYFLVLVISYWIYPLYLHRVGETYDGKENIILYLTFLANFDYFYTVGDNGMLGIQWSLSIEEQFYLFWPLLFVFFKRSVVLPIIFITLFLLSELFHILNLNSPAGYYHSVSCIRYLAFGGLLGYLCYFYQPYLLSALDCLSKFTTFLIYSISVSFLFLTKEMDLYFEWFRYVDHLFPIVFFGFVILEQNYSSKSFFKIGEFRIFDKLGKISYGLYMTHMVSIYIILRSPLLNKEFFFIYNLFLIPLITCVISSLSYCFFERPFLKLKTKFSIGM